MSERVSLRPFPLVLWHLTVSDGGEARRQMWRCVSQVIAAVVVKARRRTVRALSRGERQHGKRRENESEELHLVWLVRVD